MLSLLLIYLCVGAFAGLVAGLFGIGGGLIIVPVLVFCFEGLAVDAGVQMPLAIGTSLATIVVTSISSVRAHHARGNVDWGLVRWMAPGLVVGVYLGVQTVAILPAEFLKAMFGGFALLIALQMGLAWQPKPEREPPAEAGRLLGGGLIGYCSALFGIGGGSLTVPWLAWCNVRMQVAVASAAACGFPIALSGMLSNMWVGYGHPLLPDWSLGFVYLPALAGIVLTSTPMAKVGANLAHQLPAKQLKRGFAIFMALIGLLFIFGGV